MVVLWLVIVTVFHRVLPYVFLFVIFFSVPEQFLTVPDEYIIYIDTSIRVHTKIV